ncbi:MAG: acetoin dehydrogenase [Elusimicrobia bacterium RIFCSPLOWO2_01_FULL_54_10]|nr:MAG: acetoin dehydrogenase [Elusimicrobia bacterium RIFCSPLOWO2_01_FULL_54_10]
MARELKYNQAISEAHVQSMDRDPSVFLMGVGIADPSGLFGTTLEARKKFGLKRVFDTPMSENTLTGVGVGAAMCGMRPVLIHARNDFLLLTADQIINHAAKWSYMAGGKLKVPFLIRAIIGRGWGQAAQHSQSLQSLFAHIPGLQVIMPVTPHDAKGMILQAMQSNMTTVCIEHRWLYEKTGPVPEEHYTVPFGKGRIVKEGKDVTIVAISHMVLEAMTAVDELSKAGINAELIDLRSIRPLDESMILSSLKKTGRLMIVDTGWKTCGISAEIAALAAEKGLRDLKEPVVRLTIPEVPTPCSPALEALYYPTPKDIASAAEALVKGKAAVHAEAAKPAATEAGKPAREKEFTGPF